MAAGLPDGSYKLGVNDVIVENGDAKLPNGVRAGSTLTMAQALRNLMAFTGEGAETVSRLMTANPARLMGWAGKGSWTWERTPIWSCWTAITRWPAPWWAGAPSIQDKGITERRNCYASGTSASGSGRHRENMAMPRGPSTSTPWPRPRRSSPYTRCSAPPAILQGADLANAFMGGRVDFANGTLEDKKKGARNIAEAVKKFAEQSPIPVVLHLDHGKNFDSCVAAIEGGGTPP